MFRDTAAYKMAQKVVQLGRQEKQIFKVVLDNRFIKGLIIDLQTEDQLGTDHVDSKGDALFNELTGRTTYSLFDPKGRGGKPYELRDTGDFWRSTAVTILEGEILIKMDPIKDGDNLFEIYGDAVEGLTQENIEVLIREALKLHIEFFRKELTRRA